MARGGKRLGAGRKPVPEAIKRLRGSARERADAPNPALLAVSDAEPPDFLDPNAIVKWKDLAPKLGALRILTELDLWILAATCQAYSDWRDCQEILSHYGRTYATDSGDGLRVLIRPRPEAQQASDAWRRWVSGMRELGLTPSSRNKVSTAEPPSDSGGLDGWNEG